MVYIPRDFTNPLPTETGIAPNTVLGRLSAKETIVEFFYVKTLLRGFNAAPGFGGQSTRGSWTIQIRASPDPDSRVLFDHSVDMGITTIAAVDPLFGGIGLYDWFFQLDHGISIGKFKTRICDGEWVPVVVPEYSGPPDPEPPAGAPEEPSYPHLWEQKQLTIRCTLPNLPKDAERLALWAANNQNGPYIKIGDGMPGDDFTISITTVAASKTESIWVRTEAINENGSRFGPRVNDEYTHIEGITQVKGYQGWKFIGGDVGTLTPFVEQSLVVTPETGGQFTTGGGQIIGTWQSSAYRCSLPPGAIVTVEHDNWAGATVIRNRHTFAFGVKYGALREPMLYAPQTGETWAFYNDNAQLKCARVRCTEDIYKLPADAPTLLMDDDILQSERTWAILQTAWPVVFAQKGLTLYCCETMDKGRSWEESEMVLTGVRVLALTSNDEGSEVWIYGLDDKEEDPVRVVLRRNQDADGESGWTVAQREIIDWSALAGDAPRDSWEVVDVTRPAGTSGLAWIWLKNEAVLHCYETRDYFAEWIPRKADAADAG